MSRTFTLLTSLPFSWECMTEMGPICDTETTYTSLVPGVTVKVLNLTASRKRFGRDEVGVKVMAGELALIRAWLEAAEVHHNGGVCSIDSEELSESLNELMIKAMAAPGDTGPIMYQEEE